ncbi:MAG: hypothetical protein FWF49_05275, partial [Oscillospiraceae bacterium]|nr:hypothetical protein [Oscillospiraceae bacterium]
MKRILSWAMIIAMLMTFILFDATVFTALAAPTTFADETALQAALTAASPGDSVDLSGAVSLTADLSIPIGVILTSSDGTGELDLDSGSYGNAPIVLGYSGLAY